ncbi:cytochrome P450 [Obelidium mucronatum]|nr:cytochrome P450 [Obelidium mucronatum]
MGYIEPIIASVTVVAAATLWNSLKPSKRSEDAPPMAANGHILLGHVPLLMRGMNRFAEALFEGIDSNIVEYWIGNPAAYMIQGTDEARAIYTNVNLNERHARLYDLKQAMIHEGLLFNSNIESWKRNRKILVESIGRPRFIRSLAPKINQLMGTACDLLDALHNSQTPILANVFFGSISLDIMFDTIFTDSRRATESYLTHPDQKVGSDPILTILPESMNATFFFLTTPSFLYDYVPFFYKRAVLYRKAVAEWHKFVTDLVDLKCNENINSAKDAETEDLLTSLLLACEGDDDNGRHAIVQVIKEAFSGGTDTTSHTMAFMSYELARHPNFANEIYNEIMDLVGENGEFTAENIGKLKYLEAAIHETTRLHAVVQINPRFLKEDVMVGKYRLQKGKVAVVATRRNQLSETLWEQPLEFKPHRFLESKDLGGPLGFGFAHVPFGYGVRKCPGEALAMMEIKLVMANLIRRFSFELVNPSEPLGVRQGLTVQCRDLPMRFKQRS